MKRYMCNQINKDNLEKEVKVYGWIKKIRKLGKLNFVTLSDYTGATQVILGEQLTNIKLNREDVVEIIGIVKLRKDANLQIKNGEIEIIAHKVEIINQAKTPPLIIEDTTDALEEVRFKYRYLDLRRPNVQTKIRVRHQIMQTIRQFLNDEAFIEVETPILSKSTPEGARDYLVPSRVNKGQFYALPQSPQVYKQLLMISGFDRYYQIARVFRDEDLRIDRQPEFTQVDLEMAFMDEDQIQVLMEKMFVDLMKKVKNIDISTPFLKMTYDEAIEVYGSDKPDLRNPLKLTNLTNIFTNSQYNIFKMAKRVSGIIIDQKISNKQVKNYEKIVKTYQAKGLAVIANVEGELKGPIVKFLSETEIKELLKIVKEQQTILIVADEYPIVQNSLGYLRLELAKDFNLIDETQFNFLWVVDWPLFEYSEEDGRYFACHHPFTAESLATKNSTNLEAKKARAYDLVLNGFEIGGGSIRITNSNEQKQMFETLGFTDEEISEQFGDLIEAYQYGAPKHGGIAFGLDRIVMLLTNSENIKDVIAFPKNLQARDTMFETPTKVSENQLLELNLVVKNKK